MHGAMQFLRTASTHCMQALGEHFMTAQEVLSVVVLYEAAVKVGGDAGTVQCGM